MFFFCTPGCPKNGYCTENPPAATSTMQPGQVNTIQVAPAMATSQQPITTVMMTASKCPCCLGRFTGKFEVSYVSVYISLDLSFLPKLHIVESVFSRPKLTASSMFRNARQATGWHNDLSQYMTQDQFQEEIQEFNKRYTQPSQCLQKGLLFGGIGTLACGCCFGVIFGGACLCFCPC